jgi:hypothetical protein
VRFSSVNLSFLLILSFHVSLPTSVPVPLDNHDTLWTRELCF